MFSWLWNEIKTWWIRKKHWSRNSKRVRYVSASSNEEKQSVKQKLIENYVFFLIQQIIRQDFQYWLFYACLRFDKNIRLIIYSYYAKYFQSEDYIFFRHIDMNVTNFFKNDHDDNIIQGLIFLSDENFDECIEIVLEFYHKIADWWKNVEAQCKFTNEFVIDLEKIWLKKNNEKYNVFVFVSCARDVVRMIRFDISHGSTVIKNEKIKKTILLWFVKVRDNEINVDNEKFDQWINLIQFHFNHEVLKLISSNLDNCYGAISYRFSLFTQVNLQSFINNILICKTIWKNSLIFMQTYVLMNNDRSKVNKMIIEHRLTALKSFKKIFKNMIMTERVLYDEKRFFESRI